MKTVYTTSSFVPMELIAACGCEPRRLGGAIENRRLSQTEGMCSFTEAWLQGLLQKGETEKFAAIFATSCDQMRRAFDLYRYHSAQPAFLLNVPATMTQHGLDYYRQELERLQRFLCDFGGIPFDKDRLKMMMTAPVPQKTIADGKSLNIAITGESVSASIHDALNVILKLSNAGIALDVTEEKLADAFVKRNHTPLQRDPLAELASRLFQLPAVWRRPNHTFYQALAEKVEQQSLDGLIVFRYVFCDLWHSAIYELKKRLPIPILQLDLDDTNALSASVVSRVQAFAEMLAV